jgi:hypothetical protein
LSIKNIYNLFIASIISLTLSAQNELADSLFGENAQLNINVSFEGSEKNEIFKFGARSYFDSALNNLRGFFALEYHARMRMVGGQLLLSVF